LTSFEISLPPSGRGDFLVDLPEFLQTSKGEVPTFVLVFFLSPPFFSFFQGVEVSFFDPFRSATKLSLPFKAGFSTIASNLIGTTVSSISSSDMISNCSQEHKVFSFLI